MRKRIEKEDIFAATEGGKAVLQYYFPQASACFRNGGSRNFRVRPDDRNPSATVFCKEGVWFFQDKGGADTKAYTAVQLVQREEHLTFPQALEWIARKFAPHLLEDRSSVTGEPAPKMEAARPSDSIKVFVRPDGKFTQAELDILGYRITEQVCDDLYLKPVDYYITRRNEKGKSWKITSTPEYPIFYYDYGDWGKLYIPLGKVRFMYVGDKPADYIFGERKFRAALAQAKDGMYPGTQDDGSGNDEDARWEELIICSGPSDALNVHAAGYHVCWLNSETADLNAHEFFMLSKIARNVYILYDIDDTGLASMYRIAMRYLDLRVIRLPDELRTFRTRKGGQCKDAKDFFVHFRRPEQPDPYRLFADLMKLSGSLKFWTMRMSKKTGEYSYDINNEQMYAFLQAAGYYRIPTTANSKGYTFCRIQDNVVTLIDENAISSACAGYLIEYIRTHTVYYTQSLANFLYNTPKIRLASLERMKLINPDFTSWDERQEHFFFRNGVVRVTAKGAERLRPGSTSCMVYEHKIIDHDISVREPFFDIEYTDEYAVLLGRLRAAVPRSPEAGAVRKEIDSLTDSRKYRLVIHRTDCTFMQYIWNTGRQYWRKEELGMPLTEEERSENELHFINKVMALGYLLCKYKSAGQPYAIYAMEMEQSDEGTHMGGTGKSLFVSSVEQLRRQLFINGQDYNPSKTEFLLQGVVKGVTDTVFLDDLNEMVDLHRFMPMITGKMTVNAKYAPAFTIEYKDSPKVAFTSNHAINKFDASLRRRTWFVAFSDYYHPEDPSRGLSERSPLTEFGKNLISDYTPQEMDDFYTFMFNCLSVFMKLRTRIQPPMDKIEKRNLQRAITDEFLYWAEDYFTPGRLNCLINKHDVFEDYRASLPKKYAELIKLKTFSRRLYLLCQYKKWRFNPSELLLTPSDQDRGEIHRKEDGKDVYYWYIDTHCDGALNIARIMRGEPEPDEEDMPLFNDDE